MRWPNGYEEASESGAAALFAQIRDTLSEMADALGQFAARDTAVTQPFADQVAAITARLDAIEQNATQRANEFAAFRTEIERAPTGPKRPAATGGNDTQQTDC